MKRWTLVIGLAAAVMMVITPAPATAQEEESERVYVKHDEEDWDDDDRYAFGIAFGLVDIDQARVETLVAPGGTIERVAVSSEVEPLFGLSLRIGVARRHEGRMRQGSRGPYHSHAYRGYIEPELQYWETSARGTSQSDLLLGVNFIGVSPVGEGADFFAGGGIGIHFLDQDLRLARGNVSDSETALGVNAQFGADVHISRDVTFFGMGRFDLVDTDDIDLGGQQTLALDSLQIKAMVGLRFYF